MRWTDKQEETITLRNKNILVSAAAGSGKTAVLVERIKQLIINDHVDVDRFLITTFTNAAAAEMKERLDKAIRLAMREEGADIKFLRRQLKLIPRANISTFHSFTIEVIKRYFYLIDIDPGIKIGDENQMEIFKRESIDAVFEKRFVEDYEVFSAFLTKYSNNKNEKSIKDAIVNLYKKMRSIPHYMLWAEESSDKFAQDSPISAFGLDKFIENESMRVFQEAVDYYEKGLYMLQDAGLDKLALKAEENLNLMKSIPRRLKETGEFPEIKYAQLRATKEEKEEYELIKADVAVVTQKAKDAITNLKKSFYIFPRDVRDEELKSQSDDVKYLLDILKEFENTFRAKKQDVMTVDFDDVMHYAIDILEDETACAEYRDKFEYIFVDEYQDCNQLQETIVEKISRDNNLFMVGDLKQSIYKFRLAEPELFRSRYTRYAQANDELSQKIDLNSNFRSKKGVTDTVNMVFEDLMDGYDDNTKLHCTISDEHPGMPTSVHIIPKADYEGDEEEFDDTEPQVIANLIREHLGKTIYDTKEGCEKQISYGDIVILTRGNGTVTELERYLNNCGIPAYGESGGGYFETVEVQVFVNMLRIINNTRQDIPLISVMRSVAFQFDVNEMAMIRGEHRGGSYYDAVCSYSMHGSDEKLREKVGNMLETIKYWKELKNAVSLEELARTVMESTGYYDYCSGLPVGKQRVLNLHLLIEKAATFEQNNYSGLYGFLGYIDAMIARNIKVPEAKSGSDSDNVVQIMTIHKSKGLEFPIVILAGIGKSLSGKTSSANMSIHKDYSIALTNVNRRDGWHRKTLLQKVIENREKRETIEEEIRVLYVALTRAKDRLLMVGTVKDIEKLNPNIVNPNTFVGMMYPALYKGNVDIVIDTVFTENVSNLPSYKNLTIEQLKRECKEYVDQSKREFIKKRLEFKYPYDSNNIKSKYSVSQLNRIGQDTKRVSLNKALFSQNNHKLTPAEIGSAMHTVMERIDFAKAAADGEQYICEFADELTDRELLTEDERKAISTKNIAAFFKRKVGKRAAYAEELHKEREFILQKNIEGENTVVQGIIDCYFVENNNIILIDYKNSFIGDQGSEEEIIARYKGQIDLYKEALEAATDMKVTESYLYLFNSKKFLRL